MPGILPSSVSNFFTRATDYQIDFSNTMNVLMQKSIGQYSQQELLDRATVYFKMAIGGAAGYLAKQVIAKEAGSAYTTLAVAAGVVGGCIQGHKQLLATKTANRAKVQADIDENVKGIKQDFATLIDGVDNADHLQAHLDECLDTILKLEGVDETGAVKAMNTLCVRRTGTDKVMQKIKEQLAVDPKVESISFWDRDAQEILQDLELVEKPASPQPK